MRRTPSPSASREDDNGKRPSQGARVGCGNRVESHHARVDILQSHERGDHCDALIVAVGRIRVKRLGLAPGL